MYGTRELTPREREVLEHVAEGLTNDAIAQELGLTSHTVKFHLSSAFRKLDVSNRTAAAAFLRVTDGIERTTERRAASARSPVFPARRGRTALNRLADLSTLDLPTDRRPSGATPVRQGTTSVLAPDLSALIVTAGRERAMDRITLVVSALAALLHRYTARADVVVSLLSSSVTGQPTVLAPLIFDCSGATRFGELVGEVDVRRGDIDRHGGLAVGSGGSEGADDAPVIRRAAQVIVLERSEAVRDLERVPFALALQVEERRTGTMHLTLHFDANLFDDVTARRILAHVVRLAAAGARSPEAEIGSLRYMSELELGQILVEWNATAADVPLTCVHQLVTRQATRTPKRIAVEAGTETLTYSELEARSNQVARHLVGLGVATGTLVGVCMERSPSLLVALLGVLKAGGAYVPLDPEYPAERLAFMLEDSGAPVVVTESKLFRCLPRAGGQLVMLDREWPEIAEQPQDPLVTAVSQEDLAYVIYTSGSTGTPKGVQIPHCALVNFLTSVRLEPGFSAEDALLAVTTLSFDIAGLELYLPLICGGRVVLASAETARNPAELSALLEKHGATVMQATPTTWRMLVDHGWQGHKRLRALCGGEALPPALVDELHLRGVELWNMYGPTETTIWSTTIRMRPGDGVTIGRPLRNTTLYVLDERLEPLPVGVPGELLIGGVGLARGYLHRPELTAERFIEHPFNPGERLYRTGDLARYLPDGRLEFLGRLDHQVKVRGFRIELGEIEAVLARHPSVREAVVVKHEEHPGDARLVAYVRQSEESASAHELRRFVAQALPSYMVPSSIVTLDAFPHTPNGKIDRKRLPAPETVVDERETAYLPPSSELERALVQIWEDMLGIHPIGVTDNFFDLGATSIVAAHLFVRIERELNVSLPVAPIFQAPTIRELASLAEAGGDDRGWTSLVPIQPAGSKPAIFCVHGGAGTVLHLQPLARRLGEDQPFFGLQARGLYGKEPPLTTVEEMAAHYLSEIRSLQPHGPYYLGGYCFGAIVAFDMAHRLLAAGERVAMLAMFNGPSPAYIRRYGSSGGRPWQPTPGLSASGRIARVFREPQRAATKAAWEARRTKARIRQARFRLAHTFNRPLPDGLRDRYFVRINILAERRYEPCVYSGQVISFRGAGLYLDPDLGWEGLASGGIETYEVPGVHADNRDAMREPYVAYISDHLQAYLAGIRLAASEAGAGT